MDVLTDVLSRLHVSSVLTARIEASAPWGLRFEVKRIVKFCLVASGRCCLSMDGSEPQSLAAGDFLVTTTGARYVLSDRLGSPIRSALETLGDHDYGVSATFKIGGGGAAATILLGRLSFDVPEGAFFTGVLPPLIFMDREQADRTGLSLYLQRAITEANDGEPGAQLVSNWLGGILFIHAVRAFARTNEGKKSGWLGALADPRIAVALSAMHERLSHRWTVKELADEAGMSRSAFASQFKERVGESPLEYLGDWRMQVAMRLLRDGGRKLSAVAATVGYDSDSAFAKAFRRKVGITPSQFQRAPPSGCQAEQR